MNINFKIALSFLAGALATYLFGILYTQKGDNRYHILAADYQIECITSIVNIQGSVIGSKSLKFPFYLASYRLLEIQVDREILNFDHEFGTCIGNVDREIPLSSPHLRLLIDDFRERYGNDILITHNSKNDSLMLIAKSTNN